jgi:hypothetical protein
MEQTEWSENVILADAEYVDRAAFDLTVNFERMLERRVPKADLALWVECVALDGGMPLTEATEATEATALSVILIHEWQNKALANFSPGRYEEELNGKAFKGRVGECVFTAIQTEQVVEKDNLLLDTLHLLCMQKEIKRLMIIVPEELADGVRQILRRFDSDSRHATLFTMQPVQGGAYRQEMLGYSLMASLGISSKEIEEKMRRS